MSTDYEATVMLGYYFDGEDFYKPFIKARKELSHMEPRYCSKTGKKLEDVKIIDVEASEYYFYKNAFISKVEGGLGDYELHEAIQEDLEELNVDLSIPQDQHGKHLGVIIGVGVNQRTVTDLCLVAAEITKNADKIKKILKVNKLPELKIHASLDVCF